MNPQSGGEWSVWRRQVWDAGTDRMEYDNKL